MSQPPISVALASLKLPLRDAIRVAGELGVGAVEIDARHGIRPEDLSQTALRQMRKMLDDHGLKISSVSFPTRRGYYVLEGLDARVAATKEAMKMAGRLGVPVLSNTIGHVPHAETHPHERTLMLEVLNDLGAYGHKVGAWLTARTGSETGAKLAGLLNELPEGAINVALDPGALAANGLDPIEAARALGTRIQHVYATDGTRDSFSNRAHMVPLGRGQVDFPALLAVLDEQDYRGYLTLDRDSAESPAEELGRSVRFIHSIYGS